VLYQWDVKLRPVPGLYDTHTRCLAIKISLIVYDVGDLNDLFRSDAAAKAAGWSRAKSRIALPFLKQFCWRVVSGRHSKITTFKQN
jgi:hypothetical protein